MSSHKEELEKVRITSLGKLAHGYVVYEKTALAMLEMMQEHVTEYSIWVDRLNEEIKDLIHSIESKNTRIKELEVAMYKVDRIASETLIPPSTCEEVENGLR